MQMAWLIPPEKFHTPEIRNKVLHYKVEILSNDAQGNTVIQLQLVHKISHL